MDTFQTALITGGNGNLGRLVAQQLSAKGIEVFCFDLPETEHKNESFFKHIFLGDIRDQDLLNRILKDKRPQAIFHLASLLSGSSEIDLELAWQINATASIDLMRTAKDFEVGLFFFASTIATYGSNTINPLPEEFQQWPENMYGVTKVAVERFGTYLKQTHDFDFRCLRFPMVLSPFAPISAKTAYPSHACRAAVQGDQFKFPVSKDTGMSCMFLDDVIRSIIEISLVPRACLQSNAYNLHGFHFTAQQLGDKLKQIYPDFDYSFKVDPDVEDLIIGWPDELLSSSAKRDWKWRPEFDFEMSITAMLGTLT
ncbi:MAG: putative epimerase/dehydratase [Deltaproteobacteria bacterium]|jgi:threonine 3-dehydrogenase|nr:putative epimerase/dehydratase [Deltaproteobacteria bacterium]